LTGIKLKLGEELIVADWRWIIRNMVLREETKLHERGVRSRLQQICGNIFWDIGANVGFYSFWLRKNFKKVVAVEPNPQTAYALRKRIKFCLARNIEVKQVALSDNRGWTTLYSKREWVATVGIGNLLAGIGNRCSSDSLLPRFDYKSSREPSGRLDKVRENRPGLQVWTERFDDVNTGLVDLVKIDVEGAEFLVLDGMRNSLRDHLVKRLVVELHNREDRTRLESLLMGYSYAIEWLDPEHLFAKVL